MDSQRARDDLDDFMDTIDLTLSSPEPESRPPKPKTPGSLSRPPPRPQLHASSQHLRPEPSQLQRSSQQSSRPPPGHVNSPINSHSSIQRPSNRTPASIHQHTHRSRPTPSHPHSHSHHHHSHSHHVHGRSTPSQSTTVRNEPRHINPQHLSRILESTDVRALRHVMLNLCKTSPALSGAVARGLAPYSVFAQAIIKNQQRKPAHTPTGTESYGAVGTSSPRPQSTATSGFRSQSTGMRPQATGVKAEGGGAPGSGSTQPTAARTPSGSVRTEGEHATGGTSSSRSGQVSSSTRIHSPTRRRSNGTPIFTPHAIGSMKQEREGSPTDSDDSNHIVSLDSSRPSSRPREPRTPLNSSAYKTNHNIVTIRDTPPGLRCLRCEGPFVPGPDKCVHHPGKAERFKGKDLPMYLCCNQPVSSPGCTAAPHLNTQFVPAPPFDGYHFLPQPDERSNKRRRV